MKSVVRSLASLNVKGLLNSLTGSTIALFLYFVSASALAQGQAAVHAGPPTFAPGEVLVQFKASATDAAVADAFTQAGLTLREHIHTGPMKAVAGHRGITVATSKIPVLEAVR